MANIEPFEKVFLLSPEEHVVEGGEQAGYTVAVNWKWTEFLKVHWVLLVEEI